METDEVKQIRVMEVAPNPQLTSQPLSNGNVSVERTKVWGGTYNGNSKPLFVVAFWSKLLDSDGPWIWRRPMEIRKPYISVTTTDATHRSQGMELPRIYPKPFKRGKHRFLQHGIAFISLRIRAPTNKAYHHCNLSSTSIFHIAADCSVLQIAKCLGIDRRKFVDLGLQVGERAHAVSYQHLPKATEMTMACTPLLYSLRNRFLG